MLHPVACASAFQSKAGSWGAAARRAPWRADTALRQPGRSTRRLVLALQKGNLADDLLDYVTAGPKMRKWYGQAPRTETEQDDEELYPQSQCQEEDEPADEGDGSAVLVTDADTPMGEQLVLQLILARAKIKALVCDVSKAREAYGPYVQPLSFDVSNPALLARALKGCGSVVCLGSRAGDVAQVAAGAGVAHVLLLSAVGAAPQGGLLAQLLGGVAAELAELRDPAREAAVAASGQRHTIVRVQGVRDTPGGRATLRLLPSSTPRQGACAELAPGEPVAREDLACIMVQALLQPPTSSRVFQVVSTSPGAPPQDEARWRALFDALQASVGA